MSIEGAALSHLRDVHYILTHDLADVDIAALSQEYEALRAAHNGAGEPVAHRDPRMQNAEGIARVITPVALSLMRFGQAVDIASDMIRRGISSTRLMVALVALLVTILIVSGLIGLYMIIMRTGDGGIVRPIGILILIQIVAMSFLCAWLYMLQDRISTLQQEREVFKAGFWRVHQTVSSAYAVRFQVAVQVGSLSEFTLKQGGEGMATLRAEGCGSGETDATAVRCDQQLDVCSPTVKTLPMVIVDSCDHTIAAMLDELNNIKTVGIDSFDRMALWASISSGVDAIRSTVAVSADADTTSPTVPLQATAARAIVDDKIVPLLKINGLTVSPDDALKALNQPLIDRLSAAILTSEHWIDTNNVANRETLSEALEAYYGVSQYAIVSKGLAAVLAAAAATVHQRRQAENHDEGAGAAAKTAVQNVIAPILQVPELRAPTDQLHDQRQTLVADLLKVLQSVHYQIDLADYNDAIVDSLMAYYGDALYLLLRFDLDAVLRNAQNAADERPPAGASRYVDAGGLLARVKDMGAASWSDFIVGTESTRVSVKTFLTNFPPGSSTLGAKLVIMAKWASIFAGIVILVLYVTDQFVAIEASGLATHIAARSVVLAASLYALAVVCMSALISKRQSASEHNEQAIRRNGSKLVASVAETTVAASSLEATKGTSPGAAAAQTYVTKAVAAITAYDACNSVTNGARMMPFPMVDIIIYGFVAVVVVASALYGIGQLAPGEKVANIRILMRLRDRIMDGEVPPGLSSQLECCSPSAQVWNVLMWMSVVVLLVLNVWVMSNVSNTKDDYKMSLQLVDDCVKESG